MNVSGRSMARDEGPLYDLLNRPVRLHRSARVGLALVVVLGGAASVLTGSLFLSNMPNVAVPHPWGFLSLSLVMVAMGSGFVYVGARLMSAQAVTGNLLGPRARMICGALGGVLAMCEALGASRSESVPLAVGAALGGLMAYWILRSVRACA